MYINTSNTDRSGRISKPLIVFVFIVAVGFGGFYFAVMKQAADDEIRYKNVSLTTPVGVEVSIDGKIIKPKKLLNKLMNRNKKSKTTDYLLKIPVDSNKTVVITENGQKHEFNIKIEKDKKHYIYHYSNGQLNSIL